MSRITAILVLAVAMLFAMGQVVSADGNGPSSCDSGHGAFGAFSHHFAANGGVNWISADAQEDGGIGHDTGPTNSGFSAFCNAQ